MCAEYRPLIALQFVTSRAPASLRGTCDTALSMLNPPSAKSPSTPLAAWRRLIALVRVLRRKARRPGGSAREAPLRAELFSAEQMEHHGASLAAASHRLGERATRNRLLPRLAQNEGVLAQA